jgi:hypothetical protein
MPLEPTKHVNGRMWRLGVSAKSERKHHFLRASFYSIHTSAVMDL